MADKDTNEFENAVGGFAIARVPHLVSALLGVGGLVAAYFMTVSEFKVKDMELQQRVTHMEQKVDRIEQTVDSIKNKLESRIPVVDEDRQSLRQEIDGLKEILQQVKPYLKR